MKAKEVNRILKNDPWAEVALPIVQEFVRAVREKAPEGAQTSPAAYEALGQTLTAGIVQIWRLKGVRSLAKAVFGRN